MRIIPHGCPFISHLLSSASAVPLQPISCTSTLLQKIWKLFLDEWNGFSMFCDDYVLSPENLQLFTDAPPSVGFRGFYKGRWLAALWPPKFLDSCSNALIRSFRAVSYCNRGHPRRSKGVLTHSDNEAVVKISDTLTISPMSNLDCHQLSIHHQSRLHSRSL